MSALHSAWARARALPESTVRWIATAVVSVPIVVALVALATHEWYPVLDLAMTELRVRDVGTAHTPLIGLPGRIGDLPEQGSHPGPLSFYLLAPFYRIFASSAFGLEVGMAVLAIVAIAVGLWLAQRRGGVPMILVVAGLFIVMIRGYGVSVPEIDGNVVVQPWNPYLPLLFWLVVLLAAWSVLAGDRLMLVVLVTAGSLCAQTHIPYLGLGIGMTAICVTWTITEWFRHTLVRNVIVRAWQLSAVAVVVLWIPVLIDQLTETPGNISLIREHFSNPPEPVVGFGEGFQLMLRHLDVFRLAGESLDGDGFLLRAGFDLTGAIGPGLIFLLMWLGAVGFAVSLRDRRLIALHATLGGSLVLGWISMSRIFGKVWFYLTLWSWATTMLMLLAIAWTAIAYARGVPDESRPSRGRSLTAALGALGAAVAAISLVVVTVEATDAIPPEEGLSDTLGELVGPTEEAIRLGAGAADGADGTYLVTFDDASTFGSQAFGLVSELERRGLDVGMDEYWHVPITAHRVVHPLVATAEIHLATGAYVAEWQARPDAHQVVFVEPRDEAELARYAELEAELVAELEALGLDDLVPLVTSNLFGLQLDPRVPASLQAVVNEMLHLGQPTAVFILPVSVDGWSAPVRRALATAGAEIAAVTIAVIPIVVAFIRSVTTSWIPIGDNALVEIRSRDVFSTEHFPLLGTWSSASRSAGKDLNHPGPLLFDLLAVPVRVLGGPVGVALGVATINALAVIGIAVVARRIAGRQAALAATLVAATLSWTLGSELLISPWNPHVLILPFLLVLVLAWGVGAGDVALFPLLLAVASLCLQTHLGYAYLVPAVVLLSLAGAALILRRRWRTDPECRAVDRPLILSRGLGSAAVVLVLWAQPLWEQFFGTGEGNLSRLLSSSGGDEPPIGLSLGTRIVGGVVAAPPWWGRSGFMETVPFTPLPSDGSTPDPAGLIGLGPALVALVVAFALLATSAVFASRRRDRPAFVLTLLAAAGVGAALLTFAIVPIGTIGLAAHQIRWVWSLGAFVAMALVVALVRTPRLAGGRAGHLAGIVMIALVGVVAAINVPSYVHLDGPSAAPEAQEPSRQLSGQIDDYEPGPGGVVIETDNLRFSEPYSTVVMSALQRNDIDFYVEDHGLVRQLGEAREFDGQAQIRLILLEDRAALDIPAGAELVALATPLSDDEVTALIDGEREMVERISTTGLQMTPEGSARVESGSLGVTVEEVDAAIDDAAHLVAVGAVSRLVRAGVLELAPEDVELFQRVAALRVEIDLTTVAVYAVPV